MLTLHYLNQLLAEPIRKSFVWRVTAYVKLPVSAVYEGSRQQSSSLGFGTEPFL